MAQPFIQTSFHAGEWAPSLNARVDLAKYQSAAELLENYYVDYRGGVSSRMGTKYVIQAYRSSTAVRLIPFQASFTVNYAMEFGDGYIRFHRDGAPVLEAQANITAASATNPLTITVPGHGNIIGETIFISNVGGMTQINNRFFNIINVVGDVLTLGDLNNAPVDATGYSAYTAGGTAQRVYTLSSPYSSADLALLKWAQNVNEMVICHPNHQPYILRLISATNWTITQVQFGASISPPTGAAASGGGGGTVNYSYIVTAVDANGQESGPSTPATLLAAADLRTVPGTIRIIWNAVTGATRYNVYKAELVYNNAVAVGAMHGFIGDATGLTFDDSNIGPDFSLTPPVEQNPFLGAGVESVTVTNPGTYTSSPGVTIAAPPAGTTATAQARLSVTSAAINNNGFNYDAGDILLLNDSGGVQIRVDTVDGGGNILTITVINPGSRINAPANPVGCTGGAGATASFNLTWGVGVVSILNPGSGYLAPPAVSFSAGAATAVAVLGASSNGNPTVPIYWQQRLALLGPPGNPQQFNISQPGSYYNFNISVPTQPDDAISGVLISGQLNTIKAAIPMPSGLIVLSDQAAWQLYGSSPGSPISAIEATAQSQAYNGANDVPPIIANFDILYVQSKGSSVRNLTYNFYTNIYTGTDISVLSSHLLFGHEVMEWAWAEEPFKVAWVVRDDGVALSLTFLKEQELIGWCHSTTEGLFKSVCAITEQVGPTSVNAVYWVVERDTPAGPVKYIERMADRFFTTRMTPWCVDSGLQYSGPPASSFTGAEHLAGMTVTGLADGEPITPFVMPSNGFFTLPAPAVIVTLGLAYTPKMKTLRIDTGNPTIQGKMKLIPAVTLRVEKALGLKIGVTEANAVVMDDLVLGKVGKMTNERVTDLVTGDVQQALDPDWNTIGQYYIEQPLPYPVTVLGVIPQLAVGDSKDGR